MKGIIDAQVKINEDFLSNWKELKYSKTKTYSKQSVEKVEGNGVLKTESVYKDGDNYRIRLHIIFKCNSKKANFGKLLKYDFVKAIYGGYPPDTGLNYVWANKLPKGKLFGANTVDLAAVMSVESGNSKTGKWVTEIEKTLISIQIINIIYFF